VSRCKVSSGTEKYAGDESAGTNEYNESGGRERAVERERESNEEEEATTMARRKRCVGKAMRAYNPTAQMLAHSLLSYHCCVNACELPLLCECLRATIVV
jgi:hypothetical protein